jgi:hypothetical protein
MILIATRSSCLEDLDTYHQDTGHLQQELYTLSSTQTSAPSTPCFHFILCPAPLRGTALGELAMHVFLVYLVYTFLVLDPWYTGFVSTPISRSWRLYIL